GRLVLRGQPEGSFPRGQLDRLDACADALADAELQRQPVRLAGLALRQRHAQLTCHAVVAPGARELRHAGAVEPLAEEPVERLPARLLHRRAELVARGVAFL